MPILPETASNPAANEALLQALMSLTNTAADQTGRLRYGMPTSQKETLARGGTLPGSPAADTTDAEAADRYAAAYLFAQAHPTLSAVLQPTVSQVKVSDLPVFGGSSPALQSYADAGAARGKLDAENAQARAAADQPSDNPLLRALYAIFKNQPQVTQE